MKEIEIKARLRDKTAITRKLKTLGCVFEKPITQQDTVYAEHVGSLVAFRTNKVFLRLRVKNGSKTFFTLKKRGVNDLDAIEHEMEVSSKDEMEKILFLMGYREAVRVRKVREVTRYDGCEICVDEVEGLGSFIEMETLTEEADSEAVQDKMFQFFLSLGVKPEDRVWSGYDILMMESIEKQSR